MGVLKRSYLSLYNWIVFFGWFQVLFYSVKTLLESGHEHVYKNIEKPLLWAQTAAVLELHCHRLDQGCTYFGGFYGVSLKSKLIYSSPLLLSAGPSLRPLTFWKAKDEKIIRYSFFGMKETFGFSPSWFLWLRYSTFILLYPTGISSEVGLIYMALPYIKASGKYSIRMPNQLNFAFDYLASAIIAFLLYVPGSPYLYTYMLGQRKRALSKAKAA
ncbi:hypothetical protein ACFE04_018774 [Oxalis oulophora]